MQLEFTMILKSRQSIHRTKTYESYFCVLLTLKMITITGTVKAQGKYLVTGTPVNSTSSIPLKISFEDMTGGTNLTLCAGTLERFNASQGGIELSSSGGPGF